MIFLVVKYGDNHSVSTSVISLCVSNKSKNIAVVCDYSNGAMTVVTVIIIDSNL